MAPLTFPRLIARLDDLLVQADEQLPILGHRTKIKKAITSAREHARNGMNNRKPTADPAALKHSLRETLFMIHRQFGYDEQGNLIKDVQEPEVDVDDGNTGDNDDSGFFEVDTLPEPTIQVHGVIEQASPASASRNNQGRAGPAKKEHPAVKPSQPKKTSAVVKRKISNPKATPDASIKKTSQRVTRQRSTKLPVLAPKTSPKPKRIIARATTEEAAYALLSLCDADAAIAARKQASEAAAKQINPIEQHIMNNNTSYSPRRESTGFSTISRVPSPTAEDYETLPRHGEPSFSAARENTYNNVQAQAQSHIQEPVIPGIPPYFSPPALNASATPQEHFLSGMRYAMLNMSENRLGRLSHRRHFRDFPNYVRPRLVMAAMCPPPRPEPRYVEEDAVEPEVYSTPTPIHDTRGRGFWDIV